MTDSTPQPNAKKRRRQSRKRLFTMLKIYRLRADTYRQMYIEAQKAITRLHDYYLQTK